MHGWFRGALYSAQGRGDRKANRYGHILIHYGDGVSEDSKRTPTKQQNNLNLPTLFCAYHLARARKPTLAFEMGTDRWVLWRAFAARDPKPQNN